MYFPTNEMSTLQLQFTNPAVLAQAIIRSVSTQSKLILRFALSFGSSNCCSKVAVSEALLRFIQAVNRDQSASKENRLQQSAIAV
ncbi:MAG: hypothetical protein HY231_15335 [Acidobacteria bacterium]|nr:hypothetical protein [Acidobacteriota bacterium]